MFNRNKLLDEIKSIFRTLSTSDSETGRLKVDVAQTGFFEGREFRFDYEISGNYVVKVSSPVNFILQDQSLASHDSEATFTAWRSEQGTPGGTFTGDDVQTLPNNGMTDAPIYAPQIVVTGGGSFTPDAGEKPREFIKSVAATATAQRTTVGGGAISERGLPPGDYYLVFTGTDASYRLVYEERP